MQATAPPRFVLRRLYPWLGRAVHVRWTRKRSLYQAEAEALLTALGKVQGAIPSRLQFELEGFMGRLHREWFPREWRTTPTYAEVLKDFKWWLDVAEHWNDPPASKKKKAAPKKPTEPLAKQPKELLALLRLPPNATRAQFLTTWRRYVKRHHPDLNPDQTPDERRRFAEAVALWRR